MYPREMRGDFKLVPIHSYNNEVETMYRSLKDPSVIAHYDKLEHSPDYNTLFTSLRDQIAPFFNPPDLTSKTFLEMANIVAFANSLNLPLPPEIVSLSHQIEDVSSRLLEMHYADEFLPLSIGRFVEEILALMQGKVDGTSHNQELHFFCAHEVHWLLFIACLVYIEGTRRWPQL